MNGDLPIHSHNSHNLNLSSHLAAMLHRIEGIANGKSAPTRHQLR